MVQNLIKTKKIKDVEKHPFSLAKKSHIVYNIKVIFCWNSSVGRAAHS